MDDNEFLFDDEENLEESLISHEEEEEEDENEEEESSSRSGKKKSDVSVYGDRLTKVEFDLSENYGKMLKAAKDTAKVSDPFATIIQLVVSCNPKHNSVSMIQHHTREMLNLNGKQRVPNSVYDPERPLRYEDLDENFGGDSSISFNQRYMEEQRDMIARFIDYLASRDLSKDSEVSKRRKLYQIPAFIILLFSSGAYEFILDCPTMPKVYNDQIEVAMRKMLKSRYDIVEMLAEEYEKRGREMMAARVREEQLEFFQLEPAELRTLKSYRDLNATLEDVLLYKEYRSKFLNVSKTITQDVISDYIEVVLDPEGTIFMKLKDKTRAEAINDVKQVFRDWSKDNSSSDLADDIIWKKTGEIMEENK